MIYIYCHLNVKLSILLLTYPFISGSFFIAFLILGGNNAYLFIHVYIFRYILIAWPQLYPKIYTKVKVAIYITIIWLFSYGLLVPTALGVWGTFGYDKNLGTCSINNDQHGRSSKRPLFVIGFALPCVVIVVCYAKIYWVVRQSQKRMQKHSTGSRTKRSEMHVTKMVFLIFLCFIVCYLPITVVKLFDPEVKYPGLLVIGYLLVYLASCLNPVIYVTMNKQYRQAYFDTLRCRFSSGNDSTNSPAPQSKSHFSVGYLRNVVMPANKV